MTEKKMMSYKEAAELAMFVQASSNLSAMAYDLARVRDALVERKHELNQGTEWFNKHPIMYLFSVQIGYLTGASAIADGDYNWNYSVCEKIANGEEVRGF
jgi:hypothetical protein